MLQITERTKIYINSPAHATSGGPELLHQLVHALNEENRDAYIVYYDDTTAPTPVEYRKYNLKIADHIEDKAENIVILGELMVHQAQQFSNCQVVIWWLSVDFFFGPAKIHLSVRDHFKRGLSCGMENFFYKLTHNFFSNKNYFLNSTSYDKLNKSRLLHCYQSVYAQGFLLKNGFTEILPLSDYINTDFVNQGSTKPKENKILFNPKKGFKFTKKLMKSAPHLNWVPLQNMNREQLLHEFETSKLYIDFGHHPGKDRMPREAAINGCCVITNIKGAARFYEDVPIDRKYKLDESTHSITDIIEKIEDILNNYEERIQDFEFYKKRILTEKEIFLSQVKQIFIGNLN
ncbi:hypothetical protein SAMN05518672_105141 [Chitinophaga sp. CF118]|uniref:hypothetical protein n=1 Tax=Chitinophaga sp. CF118 TaxID=1884367 RepID=UPI0008F0A773|nr:hypothetical protein [Chitinophaga sp. CF118]SFE27883.1 hypothetical protein SAMN05518672_105141 [Chitinophaga sp. CF118]